MVWDSSGLLDLCCYWSTFCIQEGEKRKDGCYLNSGVKRNIFKVECLGAKDLNRHSIRMNKIIEVDLCVYI